MYALTFNFLCIWTKVSSTSLSILNYIENMCFVVSYVKILIIINVNWGYYTTFYNVLILILIYNIILCLFLLKMLGKKMLHEQLTMLHEVNQALLQYFWLFQVFCS